MKKLAIIGASYLQMPIVLKAKEMGIETHCFAWAEGAVCKDYCDFFYPISIVECEEILKVCQEVKIDGITTIASDVAVKSMNYVAAKMNLPGNSINCANICTDKFLMRQTFEKYNLPIPKFIQLTSYEAEKLKDLRFPVIVKPVDRSGSLGVTKVNIKEELEKSVEKAISVSFAKHAIVEEFIEGKEVSVETISYKGQHFILAITDKVTTGSPYFVELQHHQPAILTEKLKQKIYQIIPQTLDALEIKNGASHSELLINSSDEVYLTEVGARMGGDFIGSDLVYLSTGYDFLKGIVNIALGNFENPIISQNKCSGVYFLAKETEHLKTFINNKENYPQIIQAEVNSDELKNIQCSADRSGYFIYQDNEKFIAK